MKFDSKRIAAVLVAGLALMFAVACSADEVQETPSRSNDGAASQVAPSVSADDISITPTAQAGSPTPNGAFARATEPVPVSVDSDSKPVARAQSSPVPSEPSIVSLPAASVAPSVQSDSIAIVEASTASEPAISQTETAKQDVSEKEIAVPAIVKTPAQTVVIAPEQTATPEPVPSPTPEPPTATPTPEPVIAAVEPTAIPVTFGTEVGNKAHSFRLASVDGPEYRLEDQAGRNVVLIFYRAYW